MFLENFLLTLPFITTLLAIAIMPAIFEQAWHKFENYILFFLGTFGLLTVFGSFGTDLALKKIGLTIFEEYLPFIIMVGTLYVISSGFYIDINLKAKPLYNVIFLIFGALLANLIGTTGASMLLIRPFIKINNHRNYQTHNIIFFIFTVSNMGGSLTPLGDPPLFLGFLEGVPFFWLISNILPEYIFTIFFLMSIYYLIDLYFYKKEISEVNNHTDNFEISIQGKRNLFFICLVICILFLSSTNFVSKKITELGLKQMEGFIRDVSLMVVCLASFFMTPKTIHTKNHFCIKPISEVARVFLVIFITMMPVIYILDANPDSMKSFFDNPAKIFWATGFLSAFLDNAPTYLLMLNASVATVDELVNNHVISVFLKAISLGSVFMGAFTYIGNAPNFMVRAIAKNHHIKMPSFFSYMIWSSVILLPIFFLMTKIFLHN
jgi:Na+/H+ antiporter NhaD/arsenite permease-like protein